ncbi:MAG: CRISPR-associated endonuclease Cas2 [Phascolarctobacterium sp.]|nr:CRISPR-associated endonuclease Cas2 [Candidatus Phascolarctobacterium caballi]
MQPKIRTIIMYDISDNKNRYKVVKLLESYGIRIQESVFETKIDKWQWHEILTKARQYIDIETDSFRMYDISRCGNETILGNPQTQYGDFDKCIII